VEAAIAVLRIEHGVRDYDTWKAAFDSDPAGRAAGGVRRYSIARPSDDPGHVIVDLPSVFNDYVLALVEAADEVLLVGSMDIPSIKNLKIGMQQLDLQAVAGPKLKLVLNHANAKVKLDVKEIERVLGMSANFPVPDDIAVPISVNAGRPVVVDEPKAPVSRALDCIAEALLGPKASTKKGRRGK